MSDEELIEKIARAIADVHNVGQFERHRAGWLEEARAALAVFREHTAPRYADSAVVMAAAEKIAEENADLLNRLAVHTAPTDDDQDVPGFAEREKRAARAWELFAGGEREMSHDFRGGYHQGLLDALRRGAPADDERARIEQNSEGNET